MPKRLRGDVVWAFVSVAFVLTAGCEEVPKTTPVHTLGWEVKDSTENHEYVFDGHNLGKGKDGFEKLIEKIGQCEVGSRLLVTPVVIFKTNSEDGVEPEYPFTILKGAADRFRKVVADRKISVENEFWRGFVPSLDDAKSPVPPAKAPDPKQP